MSSYTPDLVDVVITGDWNLYEDGGRYTEAYVAKEDRIPSRMAAERGLCGYPGAFYATPAVVEAIIERQKQLHAELIERHFPADDAPILEWDGRTLTWTEAGETDVQELGAWVPGHVRLPSWTWGPVSAGEVDWIVSEDGRQTGEPPEDAIGYEATCGKCGETYNPTGEEDGWPNAPEHYTRADGIECGGTGKITGWWS